MNAQHREATDCPSCQDYVGYYTWLDTIVKIEDGNKLNHYEVYSKCPKCGEISFGHYETHLLKQIYEHPEYLKELKQQNDSGKNSLTRISIMNHCYEDN